MGMENIAIIGAGTMGHALTQVFAQGGHRISLHDTRDEILRHAKRLQSLWSSQSRLTVTPSASPQAARSWPYHIGKLKFHPITDLTDLIQWGIYLFGVVVRSDSQWKMMKDLIEFARKNPKKLTYGSPGVGTPPHFAMEELCMAAGLELTHMPYKGIAENNAALLGGHIDVVSDSSGWAPLVDAGKFRLLATWGDKRSGRYPEAPTMKEVGYDVVARSHLGLIGPKGLPQPVVTKLHDAFQKAMEDPEFLEVMKKFDMNTYYLNSADYEKFMQEEFERIGTLTKKIGLVK